MITVHDINERHQTDNWSPIHLRIKDNYMESLAALNCYDVLLVNPVFDGMNLVAKEGPAVNRRDGVLVLSENAGAVSELSNGALIINPFDVDETAESLYRAVTMPKNERKTRATNLREVVQQNNSVKWLYYQLKDIVDLSKVES
jgi:trehalose 6-phosphate synthase